MHPFPLIRNKSLNIAALVQKKDSRDEELEFAMVQVPSVLPRIVELPAGPDGERRVILLEEVIERNIKDLFLNYNIVAAHPFRIMRNADFTLDEEEAEDLLEEIQKQLKKRQWGEVIRLEVEEKVDKRLLKILKRELSVSTEDIYEISGPLDLTFLMKMYGMSGMDPSMFGSQATLVLNANHPLVQFLVEHKRSKNVPVICKQLYDLAMLAHKPLSPEEMTAFVQRSNEIMMLLTK